MTPRRFVFDWLPALVWAGGILAASSDLFSSGQSGMWLHAALRFVLRRDVSEETFAVLHYLIRKCAHLTEYGILGALFFRAVRGARSGWAAVWSVAAVALVMAVASIDEYHQSFVPSRTGTPVDVVVDACGAALAQIVLRRRYS